MNKTLFFSGLSFFALEAIMVIIFLASQVSMSKQTFGIIVFGVLNLVFAALMLIGALKEE